MFEKLEPISLGRHGKFSERNVEDFIAENPDALGLGSLIYIGRQRLQSSGGKLDLLLSDQEGYDRYCVEVQLGKTDPSHIVRTIEYWDSERKRNKAYSHTAVIIAEDITNRFFNVISILADSVPIIALKLSAIETSGKIGLMFSKVIDTQGEYFSTFEEEEQELVTDREYWVGRASQATVKVADELLEIVREIAPGAELNFNKYYIGIRIDGQSRNFAVFRPNKRDIVVESKIAENDETSALIEKSGLQTLEYNHRYKVYRVKLKPKDVQSARSTLKELLQSAYNERFSD